MTRSADSPSPAAWGMLALLAAAQFFGMSLWFTASAAAPQLQAAWGLSAQQAGWLTGVVQLGFVAGTATAALLNLADVLPARPYFAASALAAAAANTALVLAPGYPSALLLRFVTGFFLAGVYPPAMKMVATWFRSARGLAIGTVVGALTLGKATPYLTRGLEGADLGTVVFTASAGAVLAAALVAVGYREGPYSFPRRPFSWTLVGTVVRHTPTRLATLGYLGHMWELYAMWTFVALFFAELFAGRGHTQAEAIAYSGLMGFAVIGAGALGCSAAGALADRVGRARITIASMTTSGACALAIGWMMAAPLPLVIAVAVVWGATVVADSAQFSALVTEVAPPHAVGTALTLQTSLGFLLTTVTISSTPWLRDLFGWPVAFGILALGPAVGIAAMRRFAALQAAGSAVEPRLGTVRSG